MRAIARGRALRAGSAVTAFVVLALVLGGPSSASPDGHDHSPNIRLLVRQEVDGFSAQFPEPYFDEFAFQGRILIAGARYGDLPLPSLDNPVDFADTGIAVYRILDEPPYVRKLAIFRCRNNYGQVAIHGNLVITTSYNDDSRPENRCNRDGVRIIDISDPRNPRVAAWVETSCGIDSFTTVAERDHVYAYTSACQTDDQPGDVGAGWTMNAIKIDVKHPRRSFIAAYPSIYPQNGCNEVAYVEARELLVCIGDARFVLLDATDRATPKVIEGSSTALPGTFASGSFSWDGRYLVLGEHTPVCSADDPQALAKLHVVDISDPTAPRALNTWRPPRAAGRDCASEHITPIPTRDPDRFVVAAAFGQSGLTIVDLTDPMEPRELAYYFPYDPNDPEGEASEPPIVTGAYWYNGRIYASSSTRRASARRYVLHVFEMDKTGPRQIHYFQNRLNPQSLVRDW